MSNARIKKDDTVIAVAGVDRGKKGKVLQVLPARERVLVEGLNLRKKTLRKSEEHPQGGITEMENSMALSNVMLFCPKCDKGVKIKNEHDAAKGGARKCKTCEHSFDG
ncbi:50S ribosomal protein L24 [bacterium E08(2017)]|nr:50S ribosomal protein L24 [bacterium E08(2017)]